MITVDTRKAVFLLHQEGTPIRQISRQLRLSRNAVRRIIAQSGQMPRNSVKVIQIAGQDCCADLPCGQGDQQIVNGLQPVVESGAVTVESSK